MHIKPSRVETDEVVVRLRRIEDRIVEIARMREVGTKLQFESSLGEILGLPAAEAEAERLLQTMSPKAAVEQLERDGFGRAMAESAVAVAARRSGSPG
jgi:hypothetical protein